MSVEYIIDPLFNLKCKYSLDDSKWRIYCLRVKSHLNSSNLAVVCSTFRKKIALEKKLYLISSYIYMSHRINEPRFTKIAFFYYLGP